MPDPVIDFPAAGLMSGLDPTPELVGFSAAISHVREMLARVASVERGVLLIAEPGADVESVARQLHGLSRAGFVFVAIDCGADDVDRHLFGEPDPLAPPDLESVSADCQIAA